MTRPIEFRPDPELDLVLERVVDVPKDLVWKAWTVPEHVKQWFTPAPWKTVEVRDRPSTRRRIPNGDALAGRGGVRQRGLLSANRRRTSCWCGPTRSSPAFVPRGVRRTSRLAAGSGRSRA